MPWWQPARLAGVAAASMVVAGTCAPCAASDAQAELAQWLGAAAAPALKAAAPVNDPALAGREALGRALSGAYVRLQRVGPAWLDRVRLEVAFDPTFQPYYAISARQWLLRTADRDAAIDLHGGVLHDPAGRTGGHLGMGYHGRIRGREVMWGAQAGIEDKWLQELERYTIGTELKLGPLEVRASAFDEIPQNPASRQIAARRLDGYDLAIGARIPYLPWASLEAHRSWQIVANGETAITRDRLSLRLTARAALAIEAGTQDEAALRSWFAQLRCRIDLGS